MENQQEIIIRKEDFTKEEDFRMHARAILKDIYFTEDQYQNLIMDFEIEEIYGHRLAEIDRYYKCRFPSIEYAKSNAPYSYRWLLESIYKTLDETDNGKVNLIQMLGKHYIITIQKKIIPEKNLIYFNLLNLISLEKVTEDESLGSVY